MRRTLVLTLSIAVMAVAGSAWLGLTPPAAAWQQAKKDAAPEPSWIWADKTTDSQIVVFRKSIEVPAKLKKATVSAACDNVMSLFVNSKKLLDHVSWETAFKEDVTKELKEGNNVIAIRGVNQGGAAAMLARITLETEDGKKTYYVTDGSWTVNEEMVEGWQKNDFDDSKWAKAKIVARYGAAPWGDVALDGTAGAKSTPLGLITALPDFNVELLYSVPKGEQGSWVALCSDNKGRLIASDQGRQGLYRITPGKTPEDTKVEKLAVEMSEAQGLLYAFDSLYVVVNGGIQQGSGLYRLKDTNNDDQYDEIKLLKKFSGGGEHGPHAVRLSPDGKSLYVIAGNHTKPPEGFDPKSPNKNYDEDLLLPRNPDGNGHATGVMAPGGWICRTDPEGKEFTMVAAGFRNQYDIDFNQDGELFSYDADMEWDTGAPWYRATRVNHATSGAEFGWRYGTGKWPDYYADSLGSVVDIGLGSPTGICFGTGAKFPAVYQRALFINDWTYGKIYAVHLKPEGSSYTGTFEAFVTGRPLPVTDICVNTDGNLYFTIGGRGTQSGLYRVSYTGSESTAPAGPLVDEKAGVARKLRHELEAFHGKQDEKAISAAWPHLNSQDRALRYAARIAIEHQPVATWQDKALAEKRTTASIYAMIALARSGDKSLQPKILSKLDNLPWKSLSPDQTNAALRAYSLAFIRMGKPDEGTAKSVASVIRPLWPAAEESVNRELMNVLIYLESPEAVELGMQKLSSSQTQQDQMFYAFVLRNVKDGWTKDQRVAFFSWINLAENTYRGGASFKKFCQQIRNDSVAKMSDAEKADLKQAIEGKQKVEVVKLETTRQFVHNWQMDDLLSSLDQAEKGRNFAKGKAAFEAVQCAKCHRFNGEGGATGPDITGVGARFNAQYIAESLIVPSKVVSDQYQTTTVITNDGEVYTGRIINESDAKIAIRTNPFAEGLTEVAKKDIESRQLSPLSEMPQGTINVLTKDEILDLIAYLRSAGNADDPAFKQ
jgi:putative heme-binding domain-containing protein